MNKSGKITAIFVVVIWIIILIVRNVIFGVSDKEVEQMWAARHRHAELPLKKFNEEIFSKIAFSGTVIKTDYSRTEEDDTGGSHWLLIKLDGRVSRPSGIPQKIPNIYDLAGNPIKIYYKFSSMDCVIGDDNIGNKVEKRRGESFIRIETTDEDHCKTISYNTDFDYFWKEQ